MCNTRDISPCIKESLDRYATQRIPPGGFLYAVLTNDLFEAIGRADDNNRFALHSICSYIYNHMPSSCWGSKEIVNEWLYAEKEAT